MHIRYGLILPWVIYTLIRYCLGRNSIAILEQISNRHGLGQFVSALRPMFLSSLWGMQASLVT